MTIGELIQQLELCAAKRAIVRVLPAEGGPEVITRLQLNMNASVLYILTEATGEKH